MKIEITLNQETVTETGRVVPSGVYVAEYNVLNDVHGYDSQDIDKYDAIRLNEKLINRAIGNAEDNCNGQEIIEGTGSLKEKTCYVKLYRCRK